MTPGPAGVLSARRRPLALLLLGAAVVVAAVIVLYFPLGSASPTIIGGSPLLGKPAPEIDLATLTGTHARLSDYRGRPVVVNFWASWCIPCRSEFPLLVGAHGEYAGRGLEILGVIHKDGETEARAFAASQGAGWPMLQDADDVAWNAYGGVGMPMTFFIDTGGVVRAVSYGPLTDAGFKQQVATIVPASPG